MLCYVHIPFCDSKCGYCAFNSFTDMDSLIPDYMDSVLVQLKQEVGIQGIGLNTIETLYIGGGTPSTVPAIRYKPLFEYLTPFLKEGAEITIEANPNSATCEWLENMKNLGVNRVSFGVQSFDSQKLAMLTRIHDGEQAKEAVRNAYELGFKRLSIDLIYGCGMDTVEFMEKELGTALSLPIDHVSLYSLIIEEGTPFARSPELAAENDEVREFISQRLHDNGFGQYEVANFGKSKSKHNLGYWQYKPYLGIGAGAVGFDGERRYMAYKDVRKYIENPLEREHEILSDSDRKSERILLGLRSEVGFVVSLLNREEMGRLEILIESGKVHQNGDRIYGNDFFLADGIALYLLR